LLFLISLEEREMKQVQVLNITVPPSRSPAEVIFGLSAGAVCGDDNGNKKGDSK
jgi:hypothetical protein